MLCGRCAKGRAGTKSDVLREMHIDGSPNKLKFTGMILDKASNFRGFPTNRNRFLTDRNLTMLMAALYCTSRLLIAKTNQRLRKSRAYILRRTHKIFSWLLILPESSYVGSTKKREESLVPSSQSSSESSHQARRCIVTRTI